MPCVSGGKKRARFAQETRLCQPNTAEFVQFLDPQNIEQHCAKVAFAGRAKKSSVNVELCRKIGRKLKRLARVSAGRSGSVNHSCAPHTPPAASWGGGGGTASASRRVAKSLESRVCRYGNAAAEHGSLAPSNKLAQVIGVWNASCFLRRIHPLGRGRCVDVGMGWAIIDEAGSSERAEHQDVCMMSCEGDMLGLARACRLSSITDTSFSRSF